MIGIVESIETKQGTNKKGHPWTLSRVSINGTTYSTFDAPPPVGQTIEFEAEQDGKYWNLGAWSIRTDNPAPTAQRNTSDEKRQKLIVRQNALTNAVNTLQGTDPSTKAVLGLADQYYRWVFYGEMPPEEVPEFKRPAEEPTGTTPPVEAYEDDIPF